MRPPRRAGSPGSICGGSSPSNRFIPEVDGFRFLAILIVILSHIFVQDAPMYATSYLGGVFVRAFVDGRHGVYLFFTISGFILALPFARHHLEGGKPVAIGSYFKRRLTRLEPPYVVAMLLRTPAILLLKGAATGTVGLHLLASLFYVHSLAFGTYSTINPPAWSLEVEIQFYILAPLLTAVFLIRSVALRRTVLVAAILVSGAASQALIDPFGRLSLTLLYFFQYFAAGFLLCDLYLTKAHLSLPPWVWDAIGVAALCWVLVSQSPAYPVVLPFVTICLYMAGFFGRVVRGFFSLPIVSLVGGMCYSIYLTHTAVLSGIHALLRRLDLTGWNYYARTSCLYVLCFSAILVVGTLYFKLIERPCMDPQWPRQLAARLFGHTGPPHSLERIC